MFRNNIRHHEWIDSHTPDNRRASVYINSTEDQILDLPDLEQDAASEIAQKFLRVLEFSEGNPQIDTSPGPYASGANEKVSPATSKDIYGNIKYHKVPGPCRQWNFSAVDDQSPDSTTTTYEIDNSQTSQNSAPSTCISDLSALIDEADRKHEEKSKQW